MKNKVYESMQRFHYGGLTVRLWIMMDELQQAQPKVVTNMVLDAFFARKPETPADGIAAIESVGSDRIAAAEVTDLHGDGCLVYPDWK